MEETNYFGCANPFPGKVVEPNIVKFKGHNFTRVYPSPVVMNQDARNLSYCHVGSSKLTDEVVFPCFSDFPCYSKRIAGN